MIKSVLINSFRQILFLNIQIEFIDVCSKAITWSRVGIISFETCYDIHKMNNDRYTRNLTFLHHFFATFLFIWVHFRCIYSLLFKVLHLKSCDKFVLVWQCKVYKFILLWSLTGFFWLLSHVTCALKLTRVLQECLLFQFYKTSIFEW